jgi:hypothetical protein
MRSLTDRRLYKIAHHRKKELANRPLIREQAFGEALDPDKLERLGRYEVHSDRKLERMLTMLLRLNSRFPRRGHATGAPSTRDAGTVWGSGSV